MLFCTQGLWRYHVPTYQQYFQDPVVELVQEAHREKARVVFYRYVSFAALFYGKQKIEMLHTYKFPGDPAILDHPGKQNLVVITETKQKERLKNEHPLVQHTKDVGPYAVFKLPQAISP